MLKTKGFIEPKGSKRDFKGGLSRFKLIRLRRISLATLPRYGRALRIGWAEGEGKGE